MALRKNSASSSASSLRSLFNKRGKKRGESMSSSTSLAMSALTISTPDSSRESLPAPSIDDILPIKRLSNPSWSDSLSIRGIRGFMASAGVFAGPTIATHKHDIEATIALPGVPSCRVCIYLPKTPQDGERFGVVVHLHGGGWSICNPEIEAKLCRHLCDSLGRIVAVPDYAKAPEQPYPVAIRQTYALLNWIASDSTQPSLDKTLQLHLQPGSECIAFDRTNISLTGGSSGGNIAMSAALLTQHVPLCNDAGIRAIALQYPGLDLSTPYEEKLASLDDQTKILPPPWASKLFLRCYLPHPLDSDESRKSKFISPGLASDDELRHFPPIKIITGQNDHYRVESIKLMDRLHALGCEGHSLKVFEKVAHAFDLSRSTEPEAIAVNQKCTVESYKLLAEHIRNFA